MDGGVLASPKDGAMDDFEGALKARESTVLKLAWEEFSSIPGFSKKLFIKVKAGDVMSALLRSCNVWILHGPLPG